jgi:hypothetical protein
MGLYRLWLTLPQPLPQAGGEKKRLPVRIDSGAQRLARPLPQAGGGWGEGPLRGRHRLWLFLPQPSFR